VEVFFDDDIEECIMSIFCGGSKSAGCGVIKKNEEGVIDLSTLILS